MEMSEKPEWEKNGTAWYSLSLRYGKTLGSVCREEDRRWHCYIGSDTSAANFATLKEAKQYIEGKTK
jgi:hypothetical protein